MLLEESQRALAGESCGGGVATGADAAGFLVLHICHVLAPDCHVAPGRRHQVPIRIPAVALEYGGS